MVLLVRVLAFASSLRPACGCALAEPGISLSRMVDIQWRCAACRDPKDDKFLHVAVNGEAEAIITGDADLLALHPFHGVEIVTPADFLARACG